MSKKTEAIKGVKYLHNNRIDYSKISGTLPLPNLVEIQTNSFNWLVNQGLDEVFKDIFPIKNPSETLVIQYVSCHFETPKYSYLECKTRDLTYYSYSESHYLLMTPQVMLYL